MPNGKLWWVTGKRLVLGILEALALMWVIELLKLRHSIQPRQGNVSVSGP